MYWISLRAFYESENTVMGVSVEFCVSFVATTSASEIAHSSASIISLFFPRKMLLSFQQLSRLSFQ